MQKNPQGCILCVFFLGHGRSGDGKFLCFANIAHDQFVRFFVVHMSGLQKNHRQSSDGDPYALLQVRLCVLLPLFCRLSPQDTTCNRQTLFFSCSAEQNDLQGVRWRTAGGHKPVDIRTKGSRCVYAILWVIFLPRACSDPRTGGVCLCVRMCGSVCDSQCINSTVCLIRC